LPMEIHLEAAVGRGLAGLLGLVAAKMLARKQ
jgi:hypothetical protein